MTQLDQSQCVIEGQNGDQGGELIPSELFKDGYAAIRTGSRQKVVFRYTADGDFIRRREPTHKCYANGLLTAPSRLNSCGTFFLRCHIVTHLAHLKTRSHCLDCLRAPRRGYCCHVTVRLCWKGYI